MSKVIMVQGTMSNVGKSWLVGGLCRIFKQDGYKVAPFKSQNMALNSFVTSDGLELGRAQAMQAECAGVAPSVYMNPILLKPTNDVGSQVIVNGEVIGNMPAREYFAYKKKLIPDILNAYNALQKENDIIVIEGAGSPAEINLKENDIVNMGLAKLVNAPVILVGDIDRGGVFAQLLGTLELLESEERRRVKGLIINKFRGDKSLLDSGIDMIEDMGHVPVIGTIPYQKLMIDDEDSLSERLISKSISTNSDNKVNIAVIRFPRISNYTDIAPFESIDGINVIFTDKREDIENADMVILPGSKNTISDLRWLRESGLEIIIKRFAKAHPVIGICGGFQMLGKIIKDPYIVEEGGEIRGMELIPTVTTLLSHKTRRQINGNLGNLFSPWSALSGKPYTGYEIHMGESRMDTINFHYNENSRTNYVEKDSSENIILLQSGNILGTYVHGIFDEGDIALNIARNLASLKGVSLESSETDYMSFKEKEYDKLADAIRSNLDMQYIYEILEKSDSEL
ncbi:MAG: cobyric acid synthase [Butyrivibrio sp.]|nr:cobyric acid synthase [Butyrivibrio sp.]